MASLIVIGIISVLIIGALIAASVFDTIAAAKIHKNDDYKSDKYLQKAHKFLTTAAIVGWVSLAIIITLIVLYIIFGLETIATTGSLVIYGTFFILIVLDSVLGYLSIRSLMSMKDTKNFTGKGDDHTAYKDATIAVVITVVIFSLLIIYIVYFMYSSYKTAQLQKRLNEQKGKYEANILLQNMKKRNKN
jgi:magnesium-transporting ATPase (P-type)